MANRTPFFRAPLALIANGEAWLNDALASILEPQGYHVVSALTGRELLERLPAVRPDIILLNANLPDIDTIRACRTLREDALVPRTAPIIVVTAAPATKQQRLAALRAGAWDYLSLPVDAEELVLKLDAYARVKLEVDRAVDQSPVDEASGLYTARGLERRARELVSDAFRRHAALACVALGVELGSAGDGAAAAAAARFGAAIDYVAQLLHARGRTSDAIGRLGQSEFGVLAPATDAAGAVNLVRRLARTIEAAGPRRNGIPPLRVRAGYEAVPDLHAAPVEPQHLLEHATAALAQARAPGSSERIQVYRPGAT